ncbi:uncharacterized protein [Amphiura filiformis]|uniref:uncharacterized protein isoform X1 n=1 Tax=Amphiura filiformis TaxID=82378 RepID=UPI003B214F5D
MVQVRQDVTFQYIPLSKLIKVYLEQPGMMESILSYQKVGEDNILESYRDGQFYKDFFDEENELIFPLLVYSDDFEPANPLGSRRGKHKLAAFYIQFLNIPQKKQSRLDNILLVALAETTRVAKYGIDDILKVLVNDLEKLYNDGVYIDSPGEFQGLVKPKLFQICGDNLGLHQLLGFACGFTANYPCRVCRAPRQICQEQVEEREDLLRTMHNFALDVEIANLSQTGVSRNGILNELSYYHVVLNFMHDSMHDFLEGVVPMEIKLVINWLIDEERFTLLELNSRIAAFSYGFVDKQNRPSPITASSLANPKGSSGQTASQMQCLFMNLPMMIGDKVDEDEECDVWELLLILLDIYKLIIAPSISREATFMLKARIGEHHDLFQQLFPDQPLTPKQHHMIHYPRAIRMIGPLSTYSSIRFEAKHKPLKNYARTSNNYINIAKTVAKKHQIGQSHGFLLKQNVTVKGTEVFGQELCPASRLTDEEFTMLGCALDSEIVVATAVEVNGYRIRPTSLVLTKWNEENPEFGEVEKIVLTETTINLLIRPLETLRFNHHLHCYAVKTTADLGIILKNAEELGDFRPVHVVKSYCETDHNDYISVRFQLA